MRTFKRTKSPTGLTVSAEDVASKYVRYDAESFEEKAKKKLEDLEEFRDRWTLNLEEMIDGYHGTYHPTPLAKIAGATTLSSSPPSVHLFIDGDILCYRAATTADGRSYVLEGIGGRTWKYKKDVKTFCKSHGISEAKIKLEYKPDPVEYSLHTLKLSVKKLIDKYPGCTISIFLTGNTNFRYRVYSEYKANRCGTDCRIPMHLADCKQYLVNNYNAIVSEDCEADDLIATAAASYPTKYVVCTIDKDMDMIPGLHYNWNKDKEYSVGVDEGMRVFYRQLLTGDKVDNIPGLKGIGPKRAASIIPDDMNLAADMYRAVIKTYIDKGKRVEVEDDPRYESEKEYITRKVKEVSRNARLLWLQTSEGQVWQPPKI